MGARTSDRTIDGIYQISPDDASAVCEHLEATQDSVIIGSAECARYTLRGVPAKRCDVLMETSPRWDTWTIELVIKPGRYDGTTRRRYTLRTVPRGRAAALPSAALLVTATAATYRVVVAPIGESATIETWDRLRSDLVGYDLRAIVMWHWTRYYQRPLAYEDASAVADWWVVSTEPLREQWSLAEANRSASRALYEAARTAGWRKLTLRERLGLGLEHGQWVSDAVYAERQEARRNASFTVGEQTLAASRGVPDAAQWTDIIVRRPPRDDEAAK